MKVLHTIHSLRASTGGPARCVPDLVEALRSGRIDARIATSFLPGKPSEVAFEINRLSKILGEWKPDLIHDNGLWLPVNHWIATFARQHRIPRVVSPHGMLEPWSLQHRKYKKTLAWWIYQRRDLQSAVGFHATSEEEATQIRKLGFRQSIEIVPNGVTLPGEFPARDIGKTRQMLFLSRIHPKKGLTLLVEAWSRIRNPDWIIRIVGPDELGHRAQIEGLIRQHGLTNSFSLEDAIDDELKWKAYVDAELFVLPTYSENFGIVIAEALAAGIPVITTTGTPWKNLESLGCGWCIEPSVDELESTLRIAISHSEAERQKMGMIGKAYIANNFSLPSISTKMIKFYQGLVQTV